MTIIPGSPEWHAARATVVGASEVAALFGCQPPYALSHWALWQVKAGRMPPPVVSGPRPKWGLLLEKAIASAWAEHQNEPVEIARAPWVRHPTVRLGATPDFFAGADGLLECKNVDWLVFQRTWDGEPPEHIILQMQAQLACLPEREWVECAALVGGNDLKTWRIQRRPKLIAEIERRVAAFWESIDLGEEPPIDGSDSTADALRAIYPTDDGSVIDLPAELADVCADFLAHGAARRAAAAAEQECRNQLLAALGSAREGVLPGWHVRATTINPVPDRVAELGEIIKGRAGSRRLSAKEIEG